MYVYVDFYLYVYIGVYVYTDMEALVPQEVSVLCKLMCVYCALICLRSGTAFCFDIFCFLSDLIWIGAGFDPSFYYYIYNV